MNKFKYEKFEEAVDMVCLNCVKLSEENCEHCPVRCTWNALHKQTENEMKTSEVVMERKYYEIEFGNHKDLSDLYSICIIGTQKPTLKETTDFCKKDMKNMGYDYVNDVLEITEEEAYRFFDMENEDNFPIFQSKLKKYYVTYKVEARYIVEVKAENLEGAMKKAESEYLDADFGEAEDIAGEQIIVEDENGNFIWEK